MICMKNKTADALCKIKKKIVKDKNKEVVNQHRTEKRAQSMVMALNWSHLV